MRACVRVWARARVSICNVATLALQRTPRRTLDFEPSCGVVRAEARADADADAAERLAADADLARESIASHLRRRDRLALRCRPPVPPGMSTLVPPLPVTLSRPPALRRSPTVRVARQAARACACACRARMPMPYRRRSSGFAAARRKRAAPHRDAIDGRMRRTLRRGVCARLRAGVPAALARELLTLDERLSVARASARARVRNERPAGARANLPRMNTAGARAPPALCAPALRPLRTATHDGAPRCCVALLVRLRRCPRC